ncbi:hypothetical protein [Sporosarcina thermotolerans]|uniref:hypothetical protein n=1 Tax=Sporosarcina thermotolerans TaxID=633404 RepID=UPI0036D2EF2C
MDGLLISVSGGRFLWEVTTLLWELSRILREVTALLWELSRILWEVTALLWELSRILWEVTALLWELSRFLSEVTTPLWELSRSLWEIDRIAFYRKSRCSMGGPHPYKKETHTRASHYNQTSADSFSASSSIYF